MNNVASQGCACVLIDFQRLDNFNSILQRSLIRDFFPAQKPKSMSTQLKLRILNHLNLFKIRGIRRTNLLTSGRPQRETDAKGCRIFGDLSQLKSKDTVQKNGRLIPAAKRGKEVKQIFARYFGLKNKPCTGAKRK